MSHSHHDAGGGEGFAAASWMMAMLVVIVAIVLGVALLIWAPWSDSTTTITTNDGNTADEQAPAGDGGGVNIEGNEVNVGEDAAPSP